MPLTWNFSSKTAVSTNRYLTLIATQPSVKFLMIRLISRDAGYSRALHMS